MMSTYADVSMIKTWQRCIPTEAAQSQVDAAAREERQATAREIGALTERVLLGPPGGAAGAAAWARELRERIERFRIAGSLRAPDGGADVLALLERRIERTEAAVAALLAEQS